MYVTSHYLTLYKPVTMKNTLLFALIGISLFSIGCSSAYKSTQTVDDVYYSPGRPSEERVDVKKEEEKKQQYEEYISSSDDRYLRMKVSNHNRWYALDDYNYWNDSRYDFNMYNYYNKGYNYYGYNNYYPTLNYGIGKGNYYTPGFGWSSNYTIISYYGGKTSTPGTTSGSAITAYKNKTYTNTNSGEMYYNPKTGVTSNIGNSSSSSNFSNLVKRVFASSSATNSGSSSYDRAARTYDNSSSSNSSSRTYSTPSAPATSSSAGGNSGGVSSTGSSSSGGRAVRN
jgi:hypothetical protein